MYLFVYSFTFLGDQLLDQTIRMMGLPGHWHFFTHKWTFCKESLVNEPAGHVTF